MANLLKFQTDAQGDETAALVDQSGNSIDTLIVVYEWEQPEPEAATEGNWAQRKLRDAQNKRRAAVDLDGSAILFADGEDCDYVSAKQHRRALGGAVEHGGDVKVGKGEDAGEQITLRLKDIRQRDADIDGVALCVSAASGDFTQIAGTVVRFYSGQVDDAHHVGNVRFSVSDHQTGAFLGAVKKTDDGWTFTKKRKYGPGGSWRSLAAIAKSEMRVH